MSQRGTLRTVPGIDIGTTEEALKQPALPNEVPSPGLPGSTMNTSWPARCRKLAAVTPTIPAPMTPTTFLLEFMLRSCARLESDPTTWTGEIRVYAPTQARYSFCSVRSGHRYE